MSDFEERVIACFKGLATGDAVGKQTEMLTREDVRRWYPSGLSGFEGTAGEIVPRYRGKRYEWRIGETTDDTEQTVAVARAILQAGTIEHDSVGRALLSCGKSLHPGVRLWDFHQGNDPARIAMDGNGCGAAMRVAPVGIVFRSSATRDLVEGAYQCAVPTHGGQLAICAAAAVAAAVSAALDGKTATDVLDAAVSASFEAEDLRPQTTTFTMTNAIRWVHAELSARSALTIDHIAEHYFPACPANIVPLAISLALITQSAEETTLIAANVGGDADSVASIGSAIAGALRPQSVNESWFATVSQVEATGLLDLAGALAARWPRA